MTLLLEIAPLAAESPAVVGGGDDYGDDGEDDNDYSTDGDDDNDDNIESKIFANVT